MQTDTHLQNAYNVKYNCMLFCRQVLNTVFYLLITRINKTFLYVCDTIFKLDPVFIINNNTVW